MDHTLSKDALRVSDSETQSDVMRTWFHQNFEDPAERTPYESSEGGYIWIWGGPYDAREELMSEFSDVVPEDLIEELATELENECWQWAPAPSINDYDQLVEDIALITEFYDNFSSALVDIKTLLSTEVDDSVNTRFMQMLYVNVITALETYLSDAFISTVVKYPDLMRRFIETTPEFKAEKVSLANVYKAMDEVEKKAHAYLINQVWHRIERVKLMYRDTLGINFPSNLGPIFQAIQSRHDIVHRNGRTKKGEEILITSGKIKELISHMEEFVESVDNQLVEQLPDHRINTDTNNQE